MRVTQKRFQRNFSVSGHPLINHSTKPFIFCENFKVNSRISLLRWIGFAFYFDFSYGGWISEISDSRIETSFTILSKLDVTTYESDGESDQFFKDFSRVICLAYLVIGEKTNREKTVEVFDKMFPDGASALVAKFASHYIDRVYNSNPLALIFLIECGVSESEAVRMISENKFFMKNYKDFLAFMEEFGLEETLALYK